MTPHEEELLYKLRAENSMLRWKLKVATRRGKDHYPLTFVNARNPQLYMLGMFLCEMLQDDEEAALRVLNGVTITADAPHAKLVVKGPTNLADIVIGEGFNWGEYT
jgi:hypothetical protein